MPISLHVADPIWMYQKMDAHNDGLMNACEWRLDNQPGIVGLARAWWTFLSARWLGIATRHSSRVTLRIWITI